VDASRQAGAKFCISNTVFVLRYIDNNTSHHHIFIEIKITKEAQIKGHVLFSDYVLYLYLSERVTIFTAASLLMRVLYLSYRNHDDTNCGGIGGFGSYWSCYHGPREPVCRHCGAFNESQEGGADQDWPNKSDNQPI